MNNPKNIPASIRAKLLNLSRKTKRPFNEVLQYFAIERFLYRLSKSSYFDKFFLKGALMFTVWEVETYRPTMDIDMLGKINNSIENLTSIFKEICELKIDINDGIIFDKKSMKAKETQINAEYNGIRIKFMGYLGKMKIPMKLDIGFGDIIFPKPKKINYPSLLELPSPKLFGYTLESVIAEKFHAILQHGMMNSRMKDFYDIWNLMYQFSFEGKNLKNAIQKTLLNRKRKVSIKSLDIITNLGSNNIVLWRNFLKNQRLLLSPPSFQIITSEVKNFFLPIVEMIKKNKEMNMAWTQGGPWKNI